MEVIIYKSLEMRTVRKWLYRAQILCNDAFSFEKCIDTFHSIYGADIVIEFLIV